MCIIIFVTYTVKLIIAGKNTWQSLYIELYIIYLNYVNRCRYIFGALNVV